MKILKFLALCLPLTFALAPLSALAGRDDDDDHHHHRHHHHRKHSYKQEFWDGHCKVERKWKNGSYKEKRKCRDRPMVYHAPPQPMYIAPQPQGLIINSQIHIRP